MTRFVDECFLQDALGLILQTLPRVDEQVVVTSAEGKTPGGSRPFDLQPQDVGKRPMTVAYLVASTLAALELPNSGFCTSAVKPSL